MSKKKRSLEETRRKGNNSFDFLPFLAKYRDYTVYRIIPVGGPKTFGYLGVFETGIFNYVIIEPRDDRFDSSLILDIKNFIRELGLYPALNPKFLKYYS